MELFNCRMPAKANRSSVAEIRGALGKVIWRWVREQKSSQEE
jgi:hypothetical protein